jgi:hypothetical protein
MKSRMRSIKSTEQSHENDWAEKLKKEAESWRGRKTVPTVEHKGVQIVRVPKKRRPEFGSGAALRPGR